MDLEKRVEALEAEVDRLRAVEEIVNIQNRYFYYLANHDPRICDELISHNPNAFVIIGDRGKYIGIDQIRSFFDAMRQNYLGTPGFMGCLMGLDPVIEVAKDRKTAEAIWYELGPCTMNGLNTKELTAKWLFGKYIVKYVKEDDGWKILELTFMCIFRTAYDKGWLKEQQTVRMKYDQCVPDKTSAEVGTHHPYDPHIVNTYLPGPPPKIK